MVAETIGGADTATEPLKARMCRRWCFGGWPQRAAPFLVLWVNLDSVGVVAGRRQVEAGLHAIEPARHRDVRDSGWHSIVVAARTADVKNVEVDDERHEVAELDEVGLLGVLRERIFDQSADLAARGRRSKLRRDEVSLLYASAQPPDFGIAVSVEAPHDHRLFILDGVEDALRKPTKKRPPKRRVNDGRALRELLHLPNDRLEATKEVGTQVRRALRVPSEDVLEVGLSLRRKANSHSRPSSRPRTSSHEDVALGSSR